jgi:hypothetical protein
VSLIPSFRADGTLPRGEHQATWEEIASRFGGNERRDRLLDGLRAALDELQRIGCPRVWINGSFVADKPEPNDYDGCWWWEEDMDLAALDPALLEFQWPRTTQKARYGGELFVAQATADARGVAFRDFFQRDQDDRPKGIITMNLEEGR